MDQYESVRGLPLSGVLAALEFTDWKTRKAGSEWYGRCPIHQPKKNTGSFSFDAAGKFHCFSCSAKGRGAIDLVMRVRQVNFRDAVAMLEELTPKLVSDDSTPPSRPSRAQPEPSPAESPESQSSENPPFKGSYDKFKVPSPWLAERGLTQETLDRFEAFEYNDPKRRSAYSGPVMLKIRRWSDGE